MARLLTAKQVAEELGIGRDRVYFLTREGLLPSVHLGRALRIDRVALEDWVKRGGESWPGGWRRTAVGKTGGCGHGES